MLAGATVFTIHVLCAMCYVLCVIVMRLTAQYTVAERISYILYQASTTLGNTTDQGSCRPIDLDKLKIDHG